MLRDLVEPLLAADQRLTAPGAPFELVEEDVLGERMQVFKTRPRSLRDVFLASAAHGDRDCFVFDDGTRLTYADVQAQASSLAAGLDIRPGDRVAICAANGPGWLLTFWATVAAGGVVVAMNGWWTATEMAHALELTEPKVLLGDARRLERLEGDPGVPVIDFGSDDFDRLRHTGAALPDATVDEDDPAMLIFTSGTTGRPKAAVESNRSIIGYCMLQGYLGARGMAIAGRTPSGTQPARLGVFPLFHVSGLGTNVTSVLTGGTTVWPLGRFDAGNVIRLTKEHGITAWGGTQTHVLRLLEHPDVETLDPLQIQTVGIGGSASTPELIRRTEARFPHLKGTFSTGYGSTESGGLVSWANNAMLTAVPGCVGPPLPSIQVRIVDDLGRDVPDGEEGLVAVRSPILMKEYWRHPEANRETILPGRWVKTGDVGHLQDGTLVLASRKRDMIIRGGENIYPFEIENRLEEHPDVDEVAVFGVDHDLLGQEVKAVVVTSADLSADELRAWCAETLASYKIPAHVEVRREPLPRNPTGKVMKHVLSGEAESTFVED